MTYTHLRDRSFYEGIYDRTTVMSGRIDQEYFERAYHEFFRILPDEPKDSDRATLYLNLFYVVFVGNDLLDRYDMRSKRVDEMMAQDKAKDAQIATARLTNEPVCRHCGKTGLRITGKMLHHKDSLGEPEEVLFTLTCPHCKKNTACWYDGSQLERHKTYCPKCKAEMIEKDTRKEKLLTTTYTCPACGHTYKDRLDLTVKEREADSDFERDRMIYCLHDEKARQELRDGKSRYEGMAQLGREWKEKEDNKHIYDAVAALKKLKITELSTTLAPELEKADYIEFSLDRPEIGRDVTIGFSCLDSKPSRDDYDSTKILKKTISTTLEDTNWRLMSDGIHYRLGYLSGRLRAYEQEDELIKLISKHSRMRSHHQNGGNI